jgi:hypothetical protein
MSSLKYIITIIIILAILVGGGYLYYLKFRSGGETESEAELKGYYEIDTLFTTFVYIPLLDYHHGYLKRDVLGRILDDVGKKVVKGYCFRQYEVGIGYEQVSDLFSTYLEAACKNQSQEMPKPQILSTNSVSSKAVGTYTRQDCDAWDVESQGQRKCQRFILEQLKQDGQWQEIIENSQKVLMSFMRVYCPQNTSETSQ